VIRDLLAEAWSELWRAKLRTALAVAAIAVGAFAVAAIASLYQVVLTARAHARGADWILVASFQLDRHPLRRPPRMKRWELRPDDAEAIRTGCSAVDQVMVAGSTRDRCDAKSGRRVLQGLIVEATSATTEEQFLLHGMRKGLAWGRLFTPEEMAAGARVVIINDDARRRLFGDERWGGGTIRINGVRFDVVGAEVPVQSRYPIPEVRVPYTTAQELFVQNTWLIYAHPKPGLRRQAEQRIDEILRARLGDPGRSFVTTGDSMTDSEQLRTFSYLGLVGLLTLVSAALALSNKLYIDVIERVDQIALRRALGASARHVYGAVLLEAVLICGVGCLLGGAAGWLLIMTGPARELQHMGIGAPFPTLPLTAMLAAATGLGAAAGLQAAAAAVGVNPALLLNRKDIA
jgi:ABC-type antimicrobial peptide transport system permease subunit